MMKYLFLIVLYFIALTHVTAQIDQEELIYAKMDIAPQYELWDGNKTMLMGFTSLIGKPITLQAPRLIFNEGDSIKLSLWNFSQGAPHTIHLHGLDVNQQNDGVPSLSFEVEHDETGHYYFKAPHPGTYIYHCHVVSALHVQAGMYGLVIVKPSNGSNTTWDGGYTYDNDVAWLTSELDTLWHHDTIINHPHDPLATTMEIQNYYPNYFLVNGFSKQQIYEDNNSTINSAANEVTLLRLANIGNYGNRIILPSTLNSKIISSDGRPLQTEYFSDTIVILPGERYQVLLTPTIEFQDSIEVEYFSLNTENIEGIEKIPVDINEFLTTKLNVIENDFLVYPSPTNNKITVETNNTNGTIYIYSSIGQLKLSLDTKGSKYIDVSNWDKGIYFISFKSVNAIKTKKIIIN